MFAVVKKSVPVFIALVVLAWLYWPYSDPINIFGYQVVAQFRTALAGSTATVVLLLYQTLVLKNAMSRPWWVVVFLVFLLFGCFQAWDKEYLSNLGRIDDIRKLRSESTAKPSVVIERVPLPQNPNLRSASEFLGMFNNIRELVRGTTPATYMVSSVPQNAETRDIIAGFIKLSCNSFEPRVVCNLQSPAGNMPQPGQQRISVNVVSGAPPYDARETLANALWSALSPWFIVNKSAEIPIVVKDQFRSLQTATLVWIYIGPESPWKQDDKRLSYRTQADLDIRRGSPDTPKQMALKLADEIAKLVTPIALEFSTLPKEGTPNSGMPRLLFNRHNMTVMQSYKKDLVLMTLQDLKESGVALGDTEMKAIQAKDFNDLKDDVAARLRELSK